MSEQRIRPEDVALHVQAFLQNHVEQSRRHDPFRQIGVDDVRVYVSPPDPPQIEVIFHRGDRPDASFGFRFPAIPDDDERRWTAQQWATVVASNLIEKIESGLGLPTSAPSGTTWI